MKISCPLFVFALFVFCHTSFAQRNQVLNLEDHDLKPYYFGLSFGFNTSSYRLHHTPSFGLTDTFGSVQAAYGPGFNVGIMGNLRLSSLIDLRFIPTLAFSNRLIHITDGTNDLQGTKHTEAIFMQLPLQLKFKSDRMRNFRFYGIVGSMANYDLSANARSRRSDEYLRIKPLDLGAELGFGFEFYFPNFIFSPEIKIGQGFSDIHFRDADLPLSNSLDKINSRMITLSIHLEG